MSKPEQYKHAIKSYNEILLYFLLILKTLLLKSAGYSLARTLKLIAPELKDKHIEKFISNGFDSRKVLLLILKKIKNIEAYSVIMEYIINNKIDTDRLVILFDKTKMDINNYLNKLNLYLILLMATYYFIPILVIILIIFLDINYQFFLIIIIALIFLIWRRVFK